SMRSTSTSTSRPSAPATARSVACRTEPAMRMWFSLTRIAASRPARWGVAPPISTVYFARKRSSGVVLRVSRMRARVPSTASTKRRVRVATPHVRWRKLRATRSAVRRARARPVTEPRTVPGKKRSPSRASGSQRTAGSSAWNAARATSMPATISSCFATRSPQARALSGTVTSVVRSPRPRSSSSAARTRARTRSGSSISSAPRSGLGPARGQLAFEDLERAVREALPALDRMVLDAGRRDRVVPYALEQAEGAGARGHAQAGQGAAAGGSGLALGTVDRREEAGRRIERRAASLHRAQAAKIGGTRPGGAMDAARALRRREPPRPRLFGDVGKERREQAEEHLQAELKGRHRGAAALGVGFAARARLHQLDVGVGEAVPEEALGE